VSISLPPRPPGLDDLPPVDQEALIEEARRRARRRRQRNLVGFLAALLGALWLYSLLGGGGPEIGSAVPSESSSPGAPQLKALPEELSFNTGGDIVLVHRDGTRDAFATGFTQQRSDGNWLILSYAGVDWSPDGSELLAERRQSPRRPGIALVVLSSDGTVRSVISRQAWEGRWSPVGGRIAFVRHEPGKGRVLFVVSSSGRSVTRIAAHVSLSGAPAYSWSPDGKRLAYAGQGVSGLFIVDAMGQSAHPLVIASTGAPTSAGTVHWSPDGSLIAFTTSSHVYVVRPDGTDARRVADGYDVAWSPDSKRLAVVGPAGDTWGQISVVRPDGTGLRLVARCSCSLRGPGYSETIAWSPDGSRIAYVSGHGNTVSTITPAGSDGRVVARQAARGLGGNAYPAVPLWRPSRHS
jgi:Tol biopolymer transport system component